MFGQVVEKKEVIWVKYCVDKGSEGLNFLKETEAYPCRYNINKKFSYQK